MQPVMTDRLSNNYYRLPGGYVLALQADSAFPPLQDALTEPNGLLAIGGELTPQRLLEAYRLGIFPWFSAGEPVLWWSPDPRMVLFPAELTLSKSLLKRLKRQDYQVRVNSAFREVVLACAATPRAREDGSYSVDTWITPTIVQGYTELHRLGYAHSFETWIDEELVGGLYGVAIGQMFYGESMFHTRTDASKIAFAHCVQQLRQQGYGMIDCQMKTSHLASFGAREIPRDEFSRRLTDLVNAPPPPFAQQ